MRTLFVDPPQAVEDDRSRAPTPSARTSTTRSGRASTTWQPHRPASTPTCRPSSISDPAFPGGIGLDRRRGPSTSSGADVSRSVAREGPPRPRTSCRSRREGTCTRRADPTAPSIAGGRLGVDPAQRAQQRPVVATSTDLTTRREGRGARSSSRPERGSETLEWFAPAPADWVRASPAEAAMSRVSPPGSTRIPATSADQPDRTRDFVAFPDRPGGIAVGASGEDYDRPAAWVIEAD